MSLGRNLIASMASSVWIALVGLAAVPLYLKYLGVEAYGLIGFFATMQAIFSLLDLGLATTINREVARYSATGNLREAGKLLHILAIIYWGTAVAIGLVIMTLAPFIAKYWLQSKNLPLETVSHAVMLMGLVAACRWPIGLYQGALMGAQRFTVTSGISVVMVTLGNVGAVGMLAFVSPSIELFFFWQASAGLFSVLVMRWAAWKVMGGKVKGVSFDEDELVRIWRFSVGVSGVAVVAIILLQMDKILLSRMLNLADFGRYALAGLVASGLLVLLTPIFNIIYPKLSALVIATDSKKLIEFYRLGTRLLSSILFPIAVAAAVSSEDLIFLWTRNLELAASVAPIASLLLIGTAINGVMIFPYALQLAYGHTRLPFTIAGILLLIHVPMTIFLVIEYGAMGGALAWVLLNSLYVLLGTWMTHRHLLKGIAIEWLAQDVIAPFGLSVIIVGFGWEVAHVGGGHYRNLLLSGGLAIGAILAIAIMLLGETMELIWEKWFARK